MQNLKRITLVLLMVISSGVFTPNTARAVTDGCPNTWKIDSSISVGYQELLDAKKLLGGDMVMTEGGMTLSDYSGALGTMPKPEFALLGLSDVYLYGDTKVSKKVAVQVKNCPGITEFLFQGVPLKDFFGLKITTPFIKTTADEWSASNSWRFSNFVQAQNFPACLANLTKNMVPRANISPDGLKMKISYGAISFGLTMSRASFCGLDFNIVNAAPNSYVQPVLLDLSPGCSGVVDNGNGPMRYGISINSGQTCEFAFALASPGFVVPSLYGYILSDKNQNPLYILESFKISGPTPKKITITCVKGKLTKKITAVKPLCPAGYKKK